MKALLGLVIMSLVFTGCGRDGTEWCLPCKTGDKKNGYVFL